MQIEAIKEKFGEMWKYVHRRQKVEWVLLFVVALIVGIAVKVEASKFITIGYNDYLVEQNSQEFNYSAMAKELAKEQGGNQAPSVAGGAACGL